MLLYKMREYISCSWVAQSTRCCIVTTFHFSAIPQGFKGRNPKWGGGGNVKGVGKLHSFWYYKTLQI